MNQEFREVYLKYSDRIFRYIYWHTSDVYIAEDLTSEVFLKALVSYQKFDGKYLQAWLYRIAKNKLIDFYRLKKAGQLEEAEQLAVDTEILEKLERDEETKKLWEALETLAENLKEVLILRFFEDLPGAQVAEIMKTSEGNVRILQFRALKKLKEILK